MTTEEKLRQWVEITGVDPNETVTSYTFTMDGKLSRWDIEKMNKKIQEALAQDASGLLVNILLRKYLDEYLKDQSITILEFIEKKDEYEKFVEKCFALKEALVETEDEIALKEHTQNAIRFYNYKYDETLEMYDIAMIYMSAKYNLENLTTVQFKRGALSSEAPKLIKEVYLFNNIDEVIKRINNTNFNGIMLCYIHDEKCESSYFAFVIKNGERIYLLTDKPVYSHPYQKYLSRCPGRRMEERISQAYFPYSMTGIDLVSRYGARDQYDKDENFISLGTFGDMHIEELVWCSNMFELIKEKFFDNNFECEELVYTGGMINSPMLEKKETTLALYDSFDKIELPKITSLEETEDLMYGSEKYPAESAHMFDDIVKRLGHLVKIEDIQPFASEDTSKYLEDHTNREIDLLNMNTNEFGTQSAVEYRHKWTFRFNYAKVINDLLQKEYEERKEEVENWFKRKVDENIDSIIERMIKGEINGRILVRNNFAWTSTKEVNGNIVQKMTVQDCRFAQTYCYDNERRWRLEDLKCVLTQAKGTICLQVILYETTDICELLGLKVEDLPDVLQNWCTRERYFGGNHLLSNYDPLDWVIKDIWYKLDLGVTIVLSKTAYNNKRKEYGLPDDKFWNKKTEEEG